ncbi:hypothetical protein [Burkholderia dolosa]|uniref:hypothetical protein n=1 Tax=Burkholderia dolosa TaxID=152500 RepID=UPI003525F8E0
MQPERGGVVIAERLPFLDIASLAAIARDTGPPARGTIGVTFGRAVLVLRGHATRRVLTREFRHVRRYEAAGSIGTFIARHLREIAAAGDRATPLEADARRYEFD